MSYSLNLLKKTIKHHGVGSALHVASILAINKIVNLKILRCMVLTKVKPSTFELDPKFQNGFLEVGQIRSRFGNGYNDLPANFLTEALKKGDKCVCIIDDKNEIAGYSWFSNEETPTDLKQLNFSFDPSYIYTYKVFTHSVHRGKRLHTHQMYLALNNFQKKGFKGIICYINSDNFDSLKSSYRMGFSNIGSILVVKIFGKNYHFSSNSCRKYKISLTNA